jgi:hypothetical protein
MLMKFSPAKMVWFVLPCVLFAACGDTGLHDYINDYVVEARFSSVQNADGTPVDRLPSGEIVWTDDAPPVLQVILDNPRRTVYDITYSGYGSPFVKRAAQDTTDLSSIYIELTPAQDVAMKVIGDDLYGDTSINLHLTPSAGKSSPSDIFLSILRKHPEKDNTNDSSVTATVSNEAGETITLKTKTEQTAPPSLQITQGETLTFTATGHDLENASVWILIDGLVVEQKDAETAPAPYVLPVTLPDMAGKNSSEVSLIILDNAFSYIGSVTIEMDNEPLPPWSVGKVTYAEGADEDNVVAIFKTGNTGTGYATLAEAVANSPEEGGTVILVKPTQIASTIVITKNVLLVADPDQTAANPNQTLEIAGAEALAGSLFTVEAGATFTLCGDGSGDITLRNSNGSAVTVAGAFIMDGGAIYDSAGTEIVGESGAKATRGGGVYVAENAAFTMNDGEISFNIVKGGGGVYLAQNATFTMTGGAISDNEAQIGGGVYLEEDAVFTMAGGSISGNEVEIGGGVYVVENATFTMTDGAISGNTATGNSGGVAVEGSFTMTGGAITGNRAKNYGGVGVYGGSSFTMTGGKISDNTAEGDGDGVYVSGTFTMAGGAVVAQHVYLASDKTITVSGELTPPGGTSAIITMAETAEGTTVLAGTDRYTLTTGDISMFTLTTTPPMVISLSGNTGVIASENMNSIVNDYTSLVAAIAASTGTAESPTVISLMSNIDVTASIAVASGKHIEINSAGGADGDTVSINRNSSFSGSLFTVADNASLTLASSDSTQLLLDGAGSQAAAALVTVNGTLTMNDGVTLINSNNTTGNGGGVYVAENAAFTMDGGSIKGNTTVNTAQGDGGGVYVAEDAAFTMSGGEIIGNTAQGDGGGVYVAENAAFTMNDGLINSNTAQGDGADTVNPHGGGVYVAGTFTMNGGTIATNTAKYGGGMNISADGTAIIVSGTISGNTANGHGGGINVNGTLTMTDGDITGNTVTGGDLWGGGVAVRATDGSNAAFTMNGGTISGNGDNSTLGGGVAVVAETGLTATFTINRGAITGNSGASGKSVYKETAASENGTVIAKCLDTAETYISLFSAGSYEWNADLTVPISNLAPGY